MSEFNREQAEMWANRELERDEAGLRVPRLADCDWPKEHLRRALDEIDTLRAELKMRDMAPVLGAAPNTARAWEAYDGARREANALSAALAEACDLARDISLAKDNTSRLAYLAELRAKHLSKP